MSKNEIMEEWLEMTLIEDYLYKSDQEDVELESIEHRNGCSQHFNVKKF